MSIIFDPLSSNLIDIGNVSGGSSIGGAISGSSANSALIIDSANTLQNLVLSDGQLVIGATGASPVAGTITGTSNQVLVTNGANSITLSLPQSIATTSSPTFENLYLPPNGTIDLNAAGILNFGTTTATVINIGNAGADVNIYGDTVYQNVTNLNVTDKNITLNNGGSAFTSFNSGLHIYDDGIADRGYFEVSLDMLGWNMKAPYANGVIHFENGATGFTIDQGSHNPITIATPANGLAVDPNQELSIALADISTTGALSSTDWNSFNEKVDRAGDTMSGSLIMETTGTPGEILTVSSDGIVSSQGLTVNITSGSNLTGPTGDIKIETGEAAGPDYAGSVYLTGGDNVDGNPANIVLTSGVSSGTGTNGSIILDSKNVVYLNQNASGTINASNHRIENVSNPTAPQDAATAQWAKDLSILNNVLYVSTTGNIFTGNGSLFDPYDSIATALTNAVDNAVIALLPGTYNEPTVVIPSTLTSINFLGMSAVATIVANGFSYTTSASTINLIFDKINLGLVTIDTTLALNGLIEITRCYFTLDLPYNNSNFLTKTSESSFFGGNIYGTFNASECLFLGPVNVYSGLSIFENSKYVAQVEAYGTAIVRMLDCELFGAAYFINGTTVGLDTPTWEVDLVTDYLGGYHGNINKIILANIENAGGVLAVAGDIVPTTWTGLTNNTSNQSITGLVIQSSVSSFELLMNVSITATIDSYTTFKIYGTKTGADWSVNDLAVEYGGATITDVSFNITSGGQMQISIGNIIGFSSGSIKFRMMTV